ADRLLAAAGAQSRRVAAAALLGAPVNLRFALCLVAAFASAPAHADLFYLIVGGLGGEPTYQKQFDEDVAALANVARRTTSASNVVVLSGEGATREALVKSFSSLRTRVKPADTFAMMLVGHGSFDGELYKLNLPGPDI